MDMHHTALDRDEPQTVPPIIDQRCDPVDLPEKQINKESVFVTYEDDIQKMWKTEAEREHVRSLLRAAQEESDNRTINVTRPVEPLRKKWAGMMILLKYGIHWRKPFYPLRLVKNFAKAFFFRIMGMKNRYAFRGVEFAITYLCNFKCTHCLCANIEESKTRKELTPEETARVVDEAMAMGATTFGLEGGEPLFKPDWREYIKAFKPLYNHVIISTNGFMFNEKIIKECYDLGVDTINVSLDSGIPELHDLFRRKRGSFQKVMNMIGWAEKYGIKIVVNTTLHKGNLYTTGFRELLELCERRKIMINILFAKGVGEFKDKNCMLDHHDIAAYRQIIKPYAYAHIHHTAGKEGHDDSVSYNYGAGGCPGTSEMFNMTPYGDVIQCANMHIYFGNVRDMSLREIRDKVIHESPFGKPANCFLTLDPDFMNVYYPLLDSKGEMKYAGDTHVSLEEFNSALMKYEEKNQKIVYADSYDDETYNQEHGKTELVKHRSRLQQGG